MINKLRFFMENFTTFPPQINTVTHEKIVSNQRFIV